MPSIFAFDAYGTLFDVHAAVRTNAEALGPDAPRLSELWRAKQLEYSWICTLGGRYRDFWTLTVDALDFAFASLPAADPVLKPKLLEAYRRCDCYPEVPELVRGLKAQGKQLAILSNGTPDMLAAAISAARLDGCFDAVLSVDEIRAYKVDPRVYDLVTTHFRVYPDAISFQSSNRWDVAGAAAFGLRAVWINRAGAPDEYPDLPPTAVLPSLEGLLRLAWSSGLARPDPLLHQRRPIALKALQQLRRIGVHEQHVSVLPAHEALVGLVIEEGDQSIEIALDVQQPDRLAVQPQLAPCPDLEKLFQRTGAAGQRDEALRKVRHDRFPLVHRVHDADLRQAGMGDFALDQNARYYAYDSAAGG